MQLVTFAGTITDTELSSGAKNKAQAIVIQQTGQFEFHVLVRLPQQRHWVAIATRRHPDQPRTFKNLDRLVEKLKRDFPKIKKATFQQLMPASYELDLGPRRKRTKL